MTLPNKQELARSLALSRCLQQEIQQQKAISFARFMELALYHPDFGYYFADTIDIGRQGDFITAPEISPLFAQCIAKQVSQIKTELQEGSVLELGAGTGRLASDLLLELDKLKSLPHHYYIYEISPALRRKQQELLKNTVPAYFSRIIWLDSLPANFTGIILANEVLDALPAHRFVIEDRKIWEQSVIGNDGVFNWQLTAPHAKLHEKVQALCERHHLSSGYISEINLHLPPFIQQLAAALDQGVILLIDYGYGQAEYYHPERQSGTLACFYQHRQSDPLILPGTQDITTHVDFTAVIENAADYGCELAGYTSQAAFLLACGLMEMAGRASVELSIQDEFHLHQAIKTLTLPTEMGERIKVMALSKNIEQTLLGFSMHDRRRDL